MSRVPFLCVVVVSALMRNKPVRMSGVRNRYDSFPIKVSISSTTSLYKSSRMSPKKNRRSKPGRRGRRIPIRHESRYLHAMVFDDVGDTLCGRATRPALGSTRQRGVIAPTATGDFVLLNAAIPVQFSLCGSEIQTHLFGPVLCAK